MSSTVEILASPTSYSKEQHCLTQIRKLIEESGNQLLLKNTWDFTDDFLLRYIRSRNFDAVSAFERLQNHMYVRRKKNPEVFAKLYPSAVYHVLESGGAAVLKNRDHKGRQIIVNRASHWNFDTTTMDEILLGLMILGWEMLGFKETQTNGMVVLIDARGFGLKHAKHGTPGNVQKYADLIIKASPFKCKGAHVIYAPTLFNMTMSLIKMFLPHKLRKRVHIHGNSDSLHKWLSPDILPDWLDGNLSATDAVDQEMLRGLYTKEKEDYYKSFIN